MPIETETAIIMQDGWTIRMQPPRDDAISNPLLVLIHGWTGDENSMWIFTRRLSRHFWKIAPRGPLTAPGGGFGWHVEINNGTPRLSEYKPAVDQLVNLIERLSPIYHFNADRWHVMGFSQGAMMAYAMNLLYPDRIASTGALSGYLPYLWLDEINPSIIKNRYFYIAHGSYDETIRVEDARETVRLLHAHGANVTYCEAPVGHKLSANCLNNLEEFFNQAVSASPDQG